MLTATKRPPVAFFPVSTFPPLSSSLSSPPSSRRRTFHPPRCSAAPPPLPPLPLTPNNIVSFKTIFSSVASSLPPICDQRDGLIRLTVDTPSQKDERDKGTLVPRFENNLNIMRGILKELSLSDAQCKPIGGLVEIRDNINPQGGGEYLTDDETLTGFETPPLNQCGGRRVKMLLNAGVDAITLKQVADYEDEKSVVMLVNCGLERLSWFAKRRLQFLNAYETLYYFRPVAAGWLLGCPEGWFAIYNSECLKRFDERPNFFDVEMIIKDTAAQMRPR